MDTKGQGALFELKPVAFDQEQAKQEARDALQLLEDSRAHEWKRLLLDALEATARAHETLTADDIWFTLGFGPPSERAGKYMGSVLLSGVKHGYIARTNLPAENSKRAGSHAKRVRRWRSLLYGTDPAQRAAA